MSSKVESLCTPEMILFKGVLRDVPDMHAEYRDKRAVLRFMSQEASRIRRDLQGPAILSRREVTWQHDPAQPESYRFIAIDPAAPNASHNIYDLVVEDELGSYGRLYVIRALGQADVVYSDQLEQDWRSTQHRNGLDLPSKDDRENFTRIYPDFCKAAVASQETH